MDYTIKVLRKCKEYGFKIYMNPHQDVVRAIGCRSQTSSLLINIAPFRSGPVSWVDRVHLIGRSSHVVSTRNISQQHKQRFFIPNIPLCDPPNPAGFPAMPWSTNYGRLASQTLFTLFFSGKTFAPKAIIDGENIQDWLQGRFIKAFGELADRTRDAGDLLDECVIGWDSMNEPNEGFCGYEDLNTISQEQGPTLKQ